MQNFSSYRTKFYKAGGDFSKKVRSAGTAASRTRRDAFVTQVLVPGFEEMAITKESRAALRESFTTLRKITKRARKPACNISTPHSAHPREEAALGLHRRLPTLPAKYFSPPLPSLSGSVSLNRSAHCRRYIPVSVLKVSSDDYVDARDVSWMVIDESEGASEEARAPKKKCTAARKKQSKARARALDIQESLLTLFASQAVVLEEYSLRKKPEAVSSSNLESHFCLRRMVTSREGPSRSSGSETDEPSFIWLFGCNREADSRNSQVVWKKP